MKPAADDAALTDRGSGRSADHRRHAAERPALLHPPQHQAGRGAPSCGWSSTPARCSRTTTSAAWPTSSSTWRSTGRSTSRSRTSSRSCSRPGCASAPTSTPTPASTRPSTSCRSRPTTRRSSIARSSSSRTGPPASPSRATRSTRSAASSSRNGASASAPTRGCCRQQLPVLLKGSRYAERLPIGTPDSIRTFAPERLKQFYKDWYRPDLMAVIAVGDFDKAAGRSADQDALLARFRPRRRRRSARCFDVPEHPGTRFTIATDPEATVTVVNVSSAIAARDQTTIGAYRQQTAERVVSGLLSARLGELSQKPDAPFLAAGTNRSLFVSAAEMTSMTAVVPDTGIEKGLAALFAEADRMTKFGITETELDRYKTATVRAYERLAAQTDEHLSATLADEYVRNFMQQEPIPGIGYELALIKRFLPTLTLAEVNTIAKTWMPDRNRVVAVSAPQKAGVTIPDEAKLSAIITGGSGTGLTAYVDTVTSRPLLDQGADARPHRQDRGAAAVRHHRVDALERRPGRHQADHVQPRSDPVPRVQPGRHVAGPGSRLHRRRHRQPGDLAGRPRRLDPHRSRQETGRPHRVGPPRDRRDARGPARRQRQGRPGDDVPVDLPDRRRTARRRRRVPGDGVAAAVDAAQPQRRARGGVQRHASTPR